MKMMSACFRHSRWKKRKKKKREKRGMPTRKSMTLKRMKPKITRTWISSRSCNSACPRMSSGTGALQVLSQCKILLALEKDDFSRM